MVSRNSSSDIRKIPKPDHNEYPAYASIYIDLLPDDGLLLQHLRDNLDVTRRLIGSLSDAQLAYRYAEKKWTIKEIVSHIADDERIYVYRALRFARNDATELPGFEQDSYAHYSGANQRKIGDLLEEFTAVRLSTIAFFASLDESALLRKGVADGRYATVRALAYHIAGHELRHLNIIQERYLI
jgi:uncharacterized damage-inducible protein DinB